MLLENNKADFRIQTITRIKMTCASFQKFLSAVNGRFFKAIFKKFSTSFVPDAV